MNKRTLLDISLDEETLSIKVTADEDDFAILGLAIEKLLSDGLENDSDFVPYIMTGVEHFVRKHLDINKICEHLSENETKKEFVITFNPNKVKS